MRSVILALGAALVVLSMPLASPGGSAVTPRFVVNPGGGAGDLTARTSEAQLTRRFGRRQVLRANVPIGQGEQEPATIVFPRDPKRRIEILWKSWRARVSPKHARVRGDESAWTVAPGIRLGLGLQELEALNGGPFTLTGFGEADEGTVLSWNRGALAVVLGSASRVAVRLAPSPTERRAAADAFPGSQEFSSEAMRDITPRVYEIAVDFD